MPPHIEVDSHHDEWHLQTPQPTSLDAPSPLFLDYETISNGSPGGGGALSSLSQRQSDPDFTKLEYKKMVVKEDVKAAVSRITAIIGPESAYVRRANSSPKASSATTTTAAAGAKSTSNAVQTSSTSTSATTKKSSSNNNPKGKKMETDRPISLRRATRYVSKKGWKVVKSLPNKVASSVRSVHVPCHHRNVV